MPEGIKPPCDRLRERQRMLQEKRQKLAAQRAAQRFGWTGAESDRNKPVAGDDGAATDSAKRKTKRTVKPDGESTDGGGG